MIIDESLAEITMEEKKCNCEFCKLFRGEEI